MLDENEELELLRLKKQKATASQGASEFMPKEPTAKEKLGAGLYGAAVGFGGGAGELEKFGAYTVPEYLGLREKGQRDKFMGRETIFPTGAEIEKGLSKLGIEPPREELSGYKTGGEIVGGFGTALPRLLKTGGQMALGTTSSSKEALARAGEKLGFKFSPSQVRRDVPAPARGSTFNAVENQNLANKLASKATGVEAVEITPEFVRGRLKDLGKEFDTLYKGRTFNIDNKAVQALDAIRTFETQLPPSQQLAAVRGAADKIVKSFSSLASREGAQPSTFAIAGDALQTIRNDLMAAARSASDRSDAHRLYELVDAIDGSVARNHPEIAETLNRIRPLYRNSVILEDLIRQKGIRGGDISLESLGNMLGAQKQAVRRAGGELDELGNIGRELQLRARWQKVSEGPGLADLLRTTKGYGTTALGLESGVARALQRRLGKETPSTMLQRGAQSVAAGTAVKPLQTEE
jgi:hypothetical protein